MSLKKVVLTLFLGVLVLAQSAGVVLAAAVSVTGKAKVLNTDNSYLDFTNYNSNTTVDNVTGNFSGYVFLEDVGWVAFGTTDNSLGPVSVNLTSGVVAGKAKLLNTGAYLDFTNYGSNVTFDIATGIFSGYVFSEDMGWLIFTTAPSISLTALSPDPNGDNTPTLSGTATQGVGTVSNVQFQMDSTSGSWTNCNASDGSFNSASEAFSCTPSALSDGSHTMYLRATDSNGNTTSSANYVSDTFIIDATAPSTGSISIDSGATYTGSRSATLTLSATDNLDSGSSLSMMISNDSGFSGASWETYATSKSWTLASGDGTQTVYVKFKDSSGNTGSTYSDTIILDTTGPTAPTLSTPSDGTYTNSTQPSFTFSGGSTDSSSGLDHYTASISKSSATCSSGQTCSYSFGTVTASAGFSMSGISKSLTEGTWTWSVTAYDAVGNTTSTSRTLYVDLTSPSLTASLANEGQDDGYYLVNTQSPKITGTITDNLNVNKLEVSFYKEKTFLGVVLSEDLVDQETISRPSNVSFTSWSYSFTASKQLDHGKYRVSAKAYDMAGNTAAKDWEVSLLTQEKINILLSQKPTEEQKKESAPFSIPELEKKALERRGKEAANLAQLTSQITDFLSRYLGIPITEFFGDLSTRIAYFTKTVRNQLASVEIPNKFKIPIPEIPNISYLDPIAQKSNQMAEVFNKPFNNLAKSSGLAVKQGSRSLALAIIGAGSSLTKVNENINNTYSRAQDNLSEQIANVWQGQKLSEALSLNLEQLRNPVIKADNFFTKVKLLYNTNIAIMFDKEPTKISGVTIEEIGEDYAVVSFKTNHPAWGKVNYGETLSYGHEVWLNDRTYDHQAKLTGLTPGQKYFFEVMAQNKNYTYDAYYVIQIPE